MPSQQLLAIAWVGASSGKHVDWARAYSITPRAEWNS